MKEKKTPKKRKKGKDWFFPTNLSLKALKIFKSFIHVGKLRPKDMLDTHEQRPEVPFLCNNSSETRESHLRGTKSIQSSSQKGLDTTSHQHLQIPGSRAQLVVVCVSQSESSICSEEQHRAEQGKKVNCFLPPCSPPGWKQGELSTWIFPGLLTPR